MRTNQTESLGDPKLVAAAIATGAKLVRVEPVDGRLEFHLENLPPEFTTRIVNGELTVSVKAMLSALEAVFSLIEQHKRRRRW